MKMLVAVFLAVALAGPAFAQKPSADHLAHHPGAQAQSGTLTEGEVRKVDKEAKKITIRHEAMPQFDMPGMTMVFQVKDPALLDKVKPGDKVSFEAEKLGGAFTVTKIEAAK